MTRSAAVSGTAPASLRLALPDDRATAQLGDDLALALKTGDTIGLCGDLGAGKTALARAILRTLAGDETLEVPSPTFTLVQHYGGRLPVAHVDLYRIGSEAEVDELAIDEGLEAGAALAEWPERAPSRLPSTLALVTLSIPP
ncbi:MAG TPA: tRNA (adenosine(37)-N6)-threonylcarbamoyltransferase complex ATPase subunit type 1 TsaE, partial [Rhizobiaceae bacterium]|nr:tRNA (adenosine(37)-N6)-threonylcarbamoyltransferase complex ATPase subunit type 1 TsaE [Rhizobiaceae bacterium]